VFYNWNCQPLHDGIMEPSSFIWFYSESEVNSLVDINLDRHRHDNHNSHRMYDGIQQSETAHVHEVQY
jgi:hypothetical protein